MHQLDYPASRLKIIDGRLFRVQEKNALAIRTVEASTRLMKFEAHQRIEDPKES